MSVIIQNCSFQMSRKKSLKRLLTSCVLEASERQATGINNLLRETTEVVQQVRARKAPCKSSICQNSKPTKSVRTEKKFCKCSVI